MRLAGRVRTHQAGRRDALDAVGRPAAFGRVLIPFRLRLAGHRARQARTDSIHRPADPALGRILRRARHEGVLGLRGKSDGCRQQCGDEESLPGHDALR